MKLKYEEVLVDSSYLRISLVSILISNLGFDIYFYFFWRFSRCEFELNFSKF